MSLSVSLVPSILHTLPVMAPADSNWPIFSWIKEIYIYICIYTYIYIHTHTHNEILLSHKKNGTMPFVATWMDLEIIILSEVSQKEKDKYHMISLTCGI